MGHRNGSDIIWTQRELLLLAVVFPQTTTMIPWEISDDNTGNKSDGGNMKFLSRIMIFDRKLKVKDSDTKHLRRLQHKIVMQSLVGGAIFASANGLVFILLPVKWADNRQ